MKPAHNLAPIDTLRQVRAMQAGHFITMQGLAGSDGRNELDDADGLRLVAAKLAFLALVLDDSWGEARRYVELSVFYASRVLLTGERASGPSMALLEVEHSPDTGKPQVSRVVPAEPGYGSARMSFRHFSDAFFTLWGFGPDQVLQAAARVPEAEFRSPGLIVPESGWALMRAQRALALRKFETAKACIEEAMPKLANWQQEHAAGLLAALEGDRTKTEKHLAAGLRFHQKDAKRMPGDAEGLVCYSGMQICRVALWHHLVIDEQDYLPLRLMPGHPSNNGSA